MEKSYYSVFRLLSCEGAISIQLALMLMKGVRSVVIDSDKRIVTVQHDKSVSAFALNRLLEAAGYEAERIKSEEPEP